jgi:hypothetical protein
MSTEIEQVTLALTTINKVEMGLTDLRQKYEGIVFDVSTGAGMEVAKEARRDVREPRLEVERIRKAAKAPILALGKKLDSEAARITAELEKLEGPIHLQITTEEARKEVEKEARIQAEIKRVQAIQARITELRQAPVACANASSAVVNETISLISKIAIDDTFAEFTEEAGQAKAVTMAALNGLFAAACDREAAAEKLKRDLAELETLRAANAEKARLEKLESDRIAAEERAKQVEAARAHAADLKAQRDENERIAAEAKAKLDAEAAEQKRVNEIERQRIADEKAENDRKNEAERARQAEAAGQLVADRQKFEAEQVAIAKASEPKPPPLPAARPKVKTPAREEIIDALSKHFNVTPDIALYWIVSIRWDRAA